MSDRRTTGRKPRYETPADAEAACAAEIGARGTVYRLTETTRGPVRHWLCAHGLPSAYVRSLRLETLCAAWHDTTDLILADLREQSGATTTHTTTPEPHHMMTAPRASADDAQQLAAILSRMAKPALDADAVRDLIRAELDAHQPAHRALVVTIGERTHTLPATPRHPMLETLILVLANAGQPGALSPMLVGPAGSGKTTGCEQAAVAMGLPFYTSGALSGAHELLGFVDGHGRYQTTPFRQAFEHGGLFLADEMDRSDPAAPLVLNSALANGFMAFPDRAEPVRKSENFRMVVAANTYGRGADRMYVGANQLDAATLDRFAVLSWDYDEALERDLAGDDAWTDYVQAVRKAASAQKARVIVSPRASMGGAVLRRAGMPFDAVADAVLWKGMEAEQRRRIADAVPWSVADAAERSVSRPALRLVAE